MNTTTRALILGAFVSLSLVAINPRSSQADDYWEDYWSWYDGTYHPYYQRYYSPRYDYNRGYYYRPHYYRRHYNDDGYYYYPRYRDYGTSRFGDRDYGSGSGQVGVGPLRFGWR